MRSNRVVRALRAELETDGLSGPALENLLESRDEYNVFWVPPEARWLEIQAKGKTPTIGKLIDDAMYAIETDNPKLKGELPRDYARRGIAPERLGGLIDQIAGIAIGTKEAQRKDILGRVYEYFLGKFAAAEGKLGGEFFTPSSIVRLMVKMIEPFRAGSTTPPAALAACSFSPNASPKPTVARSAISPCSRQRG